MPKLGAIPPCLEPLREGALSLPVGVLRPLLVDGRLPGLAVLDAGNDGKAQSNPPDSSGLGGRKSNMRGIGLVILRSAEGLLLLLLPERTLSAGDMGECDRGGLGARKGLFAASALIRGGAVLEGFRALEWLVVIVGARTRVCGVGAVGAGRICWRGEETLAGVWPTAFSWRSVNGLLMLAGGESGDGGDAQVWSPMAAIWISSPQLEHLIAGKKLAGRIPSAARVAASDIVINYSVVEPL